MPRPTICPHTPVPISGLAEPTLEHVSSGALVGPEGFTGQPIRLSKSQLKSIEPLLDALDNPLESTDAYALRVQHLLPDFPVEVIQQWFWDHSSVIEEYSGLDFPSLRFELVSFSPTELQLPCLAEYATVVQYRDHFLQGVDSPRMKSLAKYMEENGTWPIPPLVFANSDRAFVSSCGLPYAEPYDLLEGHHRMAILYALGLHTTGSHRVWLVQR